MNYDNESHEILHKLFVLASNDRWIDNPYLDQYNLEVISLFYPFQMSDRSLCEEVAIGYTTFNDFNDRDAIWIDRHRHSEGMFKVLVRFVD